MLPAATTIGYRSVLAVPMIHEGVARGTILVARDVVAPFSDTHISLIQTFADQAVIAIENVRLFTELQERNRALTEALEQQTATSQILRVISSSPTDTQPVFDAIIRNAVRLCGAVYSIVWRLDGDLVDLVGHHNIPGEQLEDMRREFPRPLGDDPAEPYRSIHSGNVLHIPDIEQFEQLASRTLARFRARGVRSLLVVPMLREAEVVGAIGLTHHEVGAFAPSRIELVKTFADQAVIAIENVRLFTQLQEKNGALADAHAQMSEALEQQTATAEILRVISSSPTDYQPVFDAIVRTAGLVCGAVDALLWTTDGDELVVRAHHGPLPATIGARQPMHGSVAGYAVRQARVVHVKDLTEADDFPAGRDLARRLGWRTTLSAPLLGEGVAIGAILIRRSEVRPFSDQQIALLQTFADQAVIAIENVRLFTELQERNRELTQALDKQMATSEILRVISSSPSDVQPVFDTILSSALRLMGAQAGALTRITGDYVDLAAFRSVDNRGEATLRAAFPQSLRSEGVHANAIRDRAPVNISDAQTDPQVREVGRSIARAVGYQSMVAVPMLRHEVAVGTISATRRERGGFTNDEITLLQTFANQAVIAIENVRLFKELEARTHELTRSVGELRALGEVGQAVSSTLDLQTVLSTIVARATLLAGADAGIIYEYDGEREIFRPRATERLEPEIVKGLVTAPVRKGEGATGQLAVLREPVQLSDIHIDYLPDLHPARDAFVGAGYRALLAVPLLREGHLIGGLTVMRKTPGEFPHETIELLQTFATQSFLAIQNARLFQELADKSRELEAASQHKSEFLANMSHELRTPLNAIIGFSEVLGERMFGELNEKQEEYLKDIHASGQHLLSLINDILDLSKIEAGRMELELADFDLPAAIDNALTLVRERAGRRGIALHQAADEGLGQIRGDERKIKQVLLNLLSNAIKFTTDGGRIEVRAIAVDRSVEVSVSDTGVGIAPEDQEAIFEKFRQVGTAAKKVEGTGLGLALSRKFIELHGGRIWVESGVGVGSTFTFTIPIRPGA